jgi:hypothetical protein
MMKTLDESLDGIDWQQDQRVLTARTREQELQRAYLDLLKQYEDAWRSAVSRGEEQQSLPPPGHPACALRFQTGEAEKAWKQASRELVRVMDAVKSELSPVASQLACRLWRSRVIPALRALQTAVEAYDQLTRDLELRTGSKAGGLESVMLAPRAIDDYIAHIERQAFGSVALDEEGS